MSDGTDVRQYRDMSGSAPESRVDLLADIRARALRVLAGKQSGRYKKCDMARDILALIREVERHDPDLCERGWMRVPASVTTGTAVSTKAALQRLTPELMNDARQARDVDVDVCHNAAGCPPPESSQ